METWAESPKFCATCGIACPNTTQTTVLPFSVSLSEQNSNENNCIVYYSKGEKTGFISRAEKTDEMVEKLVRHIRQVVRITSYLDIRIGHPDLIQTPSHEIFFFITANRPENILRELYGLFSHRAISDDL